MNEHFSAEAANAVSANELLCLLKAEWKNIPSHPRYLASDAGEIMCDLSGIMLQPRLIKDGRYAQVSLLRDDGTYAMAAVHRLVAEAFHGLPPTPKHEVAHGNGCGTDNRAANLRWATKRENARDKAKHGTVLTGERNPNAKITRSIANGIRGEYNDLRRAAASRGRKRLANGALTALATRFGVSLSTVLDIAHRRSWADSGK